MGDGFGAHDAAIIKIGPEESPECHLRTRKMERLSTGLEHHETRPMSVNIKSERGSSLHVIKPNYCRRLFAQKLQNRIIAGDRRPISSVAGPSGTGRVVDHIDMSP